MEDNTLKIGMAQIAPVWLNRIKTTEKVMQAITEAAQQQCELVVFGEGLLPGYPFWLANTNGSAFENAAQKEIHGYYAQNAVNIERGDLVEICTQAKAHKIAIYLGIIERAQNRGGHSLYCSLVYVDGKGNIQSVHRKLQPTYEERLTWAPGDGHGLRVHSLKAFTVGGLNCWENWMPLPRAALYGMGENVHVAVWPGSVRNTEDITCFIAKESRSFVISVSSVMQKSDFPPETPQLEMILANTPTVMADGGSCIAAPNGEWVVPPVADKEEIITGTIHFEKIYQERQNFDPSGHYSRPDVTQLTINRERQSILKIEE